MTSANGTNALAGNSCKQACWVPLHERDPVLDRTQRPGRRAAQRALRASCHQRGACGAHLSLRYASKLSLLLHINHNRVNIMAHYRPSNNKE